jgi:hypothetical protein
VTRWPARHSIPTIPRAMFSFLFMRVSSEILDGDMISRDGELYNAADIAFGYLLYIVASY